MTSKSVAFIAYYDHIIYAHDIVNDAEVGSILISSNIDIFFITPLVSLESVAKGVIKGYRHPDMLDQLKRQSPGLISLHTDK